MVNVGFNGYDLVLQVLEFILQFLILLVIMGPLGGDVSILGLSVQLFYTLVHPLGLSLLVHHQERVLHILLLLYRGCSIHIDGFLQYRSRNHLHLL